MSSSSTNTTSNSKPNTNGKTSNLESSSPKKENNPPISASPSQIISWGTTTGKLYLSDPNLHDAKSRGVFSRYLWGANGSENGVGTKEDADANVKNRVGAEGKDVDDKGKQ